MPRTTELLRAIRPWLIGYLDTQHREHVEPLLARIDAHLAQPEAHPENKCDRCGGRNVTWFTDSPLWNKCQGEYDILCPLCFIDLAEAMGYDKEAWKLAPEFAQSEAAGYEHVPLKQVGNMEVRYKPAQPEAAEPVAWRNLKYGTLHHAGIGDENTSAFKSGELQPLYAAPVAAQPTREQVLHAVIEMVRESPEYDAGGILAEMMDEALAGKVPHLLVVASHLQHGLKPPERVEAQPAQSAEPSAWLKEWRADDALAGENVRRCRVDMTPFCEPWLHILEPTITPLYAHPPAAQREPPHAQSERGQDDE